MWRAIVGLLISGTSAVGAGAQEAPISLVETGRVTTTIDHGFTFITSVRLLSEDRLLLVADQVEDGLLAFDLESGTRSVIGRRGQGPGEFKYIGHLYPVGPDSTLVVDIDNLRWHILDSDSVIEGIAANVGSTGLLRPVLGGVSRSGFVLGTAYAGAESDSLSVFLVSLRDRSKVQVTRLKGLEPAGRASFRKNGVRWFLDSNPLGTREMAVLFEDGWIAVARVAPYRVDWRAPDGTWQLGAPIAGSPERVGPEERCFAMLDQLGVDCDAVELPGWPRHMPPFIPPRGGDPVRVAIPEPGGRLVITRTLTRHGRDARQLDVIGRDGEVDFTIRLPSNARIVGFGVETAFVVFEDELGLQHLVGYAWPPGT